MEDGGKHLSLTQLGTVFGVTSHKLGFWLVQAGLRTANMSPSPRAFSEGFVKRCQNGNGYFYVWQMAKTIAVLEAAGHRRIDFLIAPFEFRKGKKLFEIVDANGSVGVWAAGEEYARQVAHLLNVAHKHGRLPSPPSSSEHNNEIPQ